MSVPPRSAVSFPIRVFIDIPSADVVDSINALVNDVNKYLYQFAGGLPPNVSTVANLPASAPEGTEWWASDGRKVAEGVGAGTGVEVYWSNGAWRVFSTDAPVLS
jgi:hypothetical protein